MPENEELPNFIDLKDVAERFGVNINTLYREIERGKLVAYKFGKEYKVLKPDVDAYVESKKVVPRQQVNSSDNDEE